MDKDVKITPEQLAKAMDADYQRLVRETMANLLESAKCPRSISARK